MTQGPVTRLSTKNTKLWATLRVLLACCAPFLVLILCVLPNLQTNTEEHRVAMVLMGIFIFAAPAAYIVYSKLVPAKVYSPREIETWFNDTRLAKVLTFLRGILAYGRTLFGFMMIAAWLVLMVWKFFLQ